MEYNARFMHSPQILAVAFTHGYAFSSTGGQYRVEWDERLHCKTLDEVAGWPWSRGAMACINLIGSAVLYADTHAWGYALVYQGEFARGQHPVGASMAGGRGGAPAEPRPQARMIHTARDAELVAAEWMTYLGFEAVAPTPVGADADVDVRSSTALAQVKAQTVPTGRPPIQQHNGVCTAAGRDALFVSLAGYTPAAAEFADQVGMALFQFNLAAEVAPVNHAAPAVFAVAGVAPPAVN